MKALDSRRTSSSRGRAGSRSRAAQGESWISLRARLVDEAGQVLQTRSGWVGAGRSTQLSALRAGTWVVRAETRVDGDSVPVGEVTVEVKAGEGSSAAF